MKNILFCFLFCCVACNAQTSNNSNCIKLYADIKSNFRFNQTSKCYQFSNNKNWDFLKQIYTNHSCLAELSRHKLEKLFGKPSFITGANKGAKTLWYKLTPNFNPTNPPCESKAVYLELTKEGHLKHADYGGPLCRSSKTEIQSVELTCSDFYTVIKEKWKYNAAKNFYQITLAEKEYYKLISDKTCLSLLSETEIYQLIGKPIFSKPTNGGTQLYYPITENFSLQHPLDNQTAIVIEVMNHKFYRIYDEGWNIRE